MARLGAPVSQQTGRTLAQLIARVVRDTRLATAPAEQEARKRGTEAMMDAWEGEVGQFAADLVGRMAAGDNPEPILKAMVDRGTNPTHQTDFILSLIVGLAGAVSLIGAGGAIVWRNVINDLGKENRYEPLAPADAADAVERNIITAAVGDGWAAQSAVNAEAFALMVELSGEPPGLVDMLRLWRRGDLDTETLEKMVAFSRVKTEWTPYVEKLAVDVPSGADAIEGYIKGVTDAAQAQTMYYEGGGRPADFEFMAETAGEAIGVESALNLLNHGLISENDAQAVIAYSRINPKFEAIAKLQRFHYLAPYQIDAALKAGAATPAEATSWLLADGYPAGQVAALVAGAASGKVAGHKDAAESIVLDSYQAGMIDRSQALAGLADLGYTGEEATLILQSKDAAKTLTLQTQAVTAIRKAYLAGRVSQADASNQLDSLGVHPTVRDYEIEVWNVERATEFKQLTAAEIGSLAKKGIIRYATAVARWVAMGYDTVDATLLSYEYGNALPSSGPVI